MTTRGGVRKMAEIVLLVVAIVLFCFSLLAVFRAPTNTLWKFAILATEGGHFIAPFGLLFLAGWGISSITRAAAIIAIAASILLFTPAIRASRVGGGVSFIKLYTGKQRRMTPTRYEFPGGDGAPRALDFYAAPAQANAPLVIMIHGGSWQGGGPGDLAALNSRLAQRGYAVAAISYRFAPAHRFPAQLDDVRAALAWLEARAAGLHIDRERVAFIGRSAGGHLAALAAMTANDPAVRGAVSLYGVHDLAWGYEHPASPRVHDSRLILRELLGGDPRSVPDAYRMASPVSFAASAPPLLLIHGTRDELVNVEHARRLAAALSAARRKHTFIELPWATHGCDYIFRGPCGQVTTHAIEEFLASVLGPTSGSPATGRL
jgi:acetyl esterase/lipase